MPNAIKYNTSTESLALRKGSFWIGTGDVGKGPTSSTGFYNGITPSAGGYTIYINKTSNGPSIYTCNSDASLISLTNSIAGTQYTTKEQCFVYFYGQSDKVVVNRDYGNYITSGLAMHVDAAFLPSYPQSGTTTLNITYSATTGDLYNGVGWGDYGVGGAFSFDGVDDGLVLNFSSVDFRYLNSPFSICTWANKTQNTTGPIVNRGNFQGGGYWTKNHSSTGFFFETSKSPDNYTTRQSSINNILTNNAWYYLVATYDNNGNCKLYCNGVDVTGTPTTMLTPNENNYDICYQLGQYNCPFYGGYHDYWKGYIAIHSSYGRLLSASEILQNFNATKSRFGY